MHGKCFTVLILSWGNFDNACYFDENRALKMNKFSGCIFLFPAYITGVLTHMETLECSNLEDIITG